MTDGHDHPSGEPLEVRVDAAPVERRTGPDRRREVGAEVLAQAVLLAAVALAALVRLVPVLSSDFPLHDGGLFMVMIQDLEHASFALPLTTTYNLDQIPFAYPPLAIYVTAGLNLVGVDLIALMRFIPVSASVATVPVVYLIARDLTGRQSIAAVSAVAFALAPRSYEWLVIGGGLTRAPGMLFALLGIWLGIRLLRQPSLPSIVGTGLFGGLTLLTHPEASLFCGISLAVLILARGRNRGALGAMLAAGAIALFLAAPWLWIVITRYGPDIVTGAANSRTALIGTTLRGLLFGHFTGATAFDLFLGIGFIGLLVEVGRGSYLLMAWVVVVPIVVVAAGFTFLMVPWAILVAIAVVDVLLPAVERLTRGRRFGRPILEVGLLGAAVLASLATGFSPDSPLHRLPDDDRLAMIWAAEHLPLDAHVAVITGLPWWNDATSEWFPAIARRRSLATPQGYEWTGEFVRQQQRNRLLQSTCAPRLADCLGLWAKHFGIQVDFVYIPKGQLAGLASDPDCCPAMRESLRQLDDVIYDDAGATIVRVIR
jgi:hypothetical protein